MTSQCDCFSGFRDEVAIQGHLFTAPFLLLPNIYVSMQGFTFSR